MPSKYWFIYLYIIVGLIYTCKCKTDIETYFQFVTMVAIWPVFAIIDVIGNIIVEDIKEQRKGKQGARR